MHIAKEKRNSEYYTEYSTISNEISKIRSLFRGKSVYCNCDDPVLSLKELVSTGKDIITILRNNIFTHMNINSVCALGGVV